MNHAKLIGLALAATAFALIAAPRAEATPIDYTFQVTIITGPLSPDIIAGTFAYDSSSIVPGGSKDATGLLTALDFTLNGITYTAATANTGELNFDSAGNLTSFLFGTNCTATGCTFPPGTNAWGAVPGTLQFGYSVFGSSAVGGGDVTFAKATAVPEPGSLALLGIALLGFGIAGFARHRRAA